MLMSTISVAVNASPERVYAYCSDPKNLPHWIPSFAKSVERVGSRWVVQTSAGAAEIEFVASNTFGVLDHHVTLPDGAKVDNVLRVIPNGMGSEVTFTLFQRPGVTDDAYQKDADMVRGDLATLKRVLESR
jgi:uncharacterized protein YndB with AHSA1/START domain